MEVIQKGLNCLLEEVQRLIEEKKVNPEYIYSRLKVISKIIVSNFHTREELKTEAGEIAEITAIQINMQREFDRMFSNYKVWRFWAILLKYVIFSVIFFALFLCFQNVFSDKLNLVWIALLTASTAYLLDIWILTFWKNKLLYRICKLISINIGKNICRFLDLKQQNSTEQTE